MPGVSGGAPLAEGRELPALRQRQGLCAARPAVTGSAKNAQANGYRFSHIAGTIFENTNKPLREWFRVVHTMLTSKKGVCALQIQRIMGFGSYETAHSMCHKIRAALD